MSYRRRWIVENKPNRFWKLITLRTRHAVRPYVCL